MKVHELDRDVERRKMDRKSEKERREKRYWIRKMKDVIPGYIFVSST